MTAHGPRPAPVPEEVLGRPRNRAALHRTALLTGGYLLLSALTLAAVVVLRDDSALVDDAVWVRSCAVLLSALVTFVCARRAARGSRPAFRRLRILSTAMTVAIVVILAVPGSFPLWMKLDQAACGLLLAGVVLAVNGRHLRTVFATDRP